MQGAGTHVMQARHDRQRGKVPLFLQKQAHDFLTQRRLLLALVEFALAEPGGLLEHGRISHGQGALEGVAMDDEAGPVLVVTHRAGKKILRQRLFRAGGKREYDGGERRTHADQADDVVNGEHDRLQDVATCLPEIGRLDEMYL